MSSDGTGREDLPLFTHTYVLGADIGVAQRDCHRHEYQGHRTRETAVKVEPYVGKITQQPCRAYLASWARRTIESPVHTDTDDGDNLVTDGGQPVDDTEREPFELIQDHRDVLRDIQQMRDNLDELETEVRRAEWVELGGRGWIDLDKVSKLCEAIEGSMPYIEEDIHDLQNAVDTEADRNE